MSEKKKKILNLFLVIINLIVVIKLLKDSFKIQGFDYVFIGALIAVGIGIYLFFSKVLKKKRRIFAFTLSMIIILGLFILKYNDYFIQEIKYIIQCIIIINDAALEGKEISFKVFKHIFSAIIPLSICINSLITRRWSKFSILFSSLIYIGFWYLIFYPSVERNLPYFIGALVASIGISEYIKKTEEYEGRELKISINLRIIITTILILTMFLPIIVKFLPQEFNGKYVDGIFETMKNQFSEKELTEEDYINNALKYRYSMRSSGYSDSSYSLGGPIKINQREVFTVKGDKPYYLRARVKDTYSGTTWTQVREDIKEQVDNAFKYEGGIAYLREALEGQLDESYLKAQEKSVVVTPEKNFKSGSCFTPNGTFKIEEAQSKVFYNDIPIFMSDDYIREPYVIKFVSYGDYDNYLSGIENTDYIKKIYEEEYTLPMRTYGQMDLDYYEYLESLVNTTDPEELRKYNKFKWLYINYMQVPETVGEEVFNLVKNILNDAAEKNGLIGIEDLSNQEKALAIRNYLKENYIYKTDVKNVNPKEDFVTQFLVRDKEGYCTYFASANTIMCRIAGIPARYVEGFNMTDRKNSKDEYVVTNEEAHAWTEILINPYRDIWGISDAVAETTEEESNLEDVQQEENTVENKPEINKPDKVTDEINKEKHGQNIIGKIIKISAMVIILVISAITLLFSIFIINRKRIISKQSLIPIYNYAIKRLKTIGIEKKENQGDMEFVKDLEDEELRNHMLQVVNGVYDEFYGDIIPNNIDKEEFLDYIENYIKSENKGHRYIVKKYCSFTIRGGI